MSVLSQLKNKLLVTGAFLLGASVGSVNAAENNDPAPSAGITQTLNDNQNKKKKEELIKSFMNTIDRFEGIVLHPYLDTKCNLTIGYGKNIQPLDAFNSVRFQGELTGNKLRLKLMQIRKKLMDNSANWKTVKQKDGTSVRIFNVTAAGQKEAFSGIHITKAEAKRLLKTHIEENLPVLSGHLNSRGLDLFKLPLCAQEVLLDIHYNTGNASPQKWPSLYNAIKAKDWTKAARETSRKDVQSIRNLWAEKQMKHAGLVSELERNGINYEQLPIPARDVVNYMSAVLKNRFTAQKWPKFFKALKNRNYVTAANECRILKINEAKNVWMKERMLEAANTTLSHQKNLNNHSR